MPRLTRYSERFAATGGIGARATHRALGPHRLGFWELFLRETLQNSWDARTVDEGPISFGVHAWHASSAERWILRDFILTDPPFRLGIEDALTRETLPLLAVRDSGTWGLSGPTRADVDPLSGFDGRSDFVDLIRDTGRRAVRGYRGGTYGFGKAVLTRASAVSTIIVYSRTTVAGTGTSRLIAMAVGDDEYYEDGRRYTGRHWWGLEGDDIAEPLLDKDADTSAAALGISGLINGQTGTVILVVAPRAPEEEATPGLHNIMTAIAAAAAEYAWPHMIRNGNYAPTIDFSFTLEGAPVPLPDPTTDARLGVFADAYRRCGQLESGNAPEGDNWPWHLRLLRSERPKRGLGSLVWRSHGPIATRSLDLDVRSEIALIRSPRFVVSYMKAPKDPSGQSTSGVFLADPALDSALAETEPPAHDEWIPLKGRRADPARQVAKHIADELKLRLGAGQLHDGSEEPGVVSVASALGDLLVGGGDPRRPWQPQPPLTHPGPTWGTVPPDGSGVPSNCDDGAASTDEGRRTYGDDGFASREGTPPNEGTPACGNNTHNDSQHGGPKLTVTARNRNPSIRHDGAPRLLTFAGHRAVEFPFIVTKPTDHTAVCVSAKADVLIDGGRETEPPAEAELPEILQWRDLTSGTVSREPGLLITQDGPSRWSVVVSQPSDAAVTVSLSLTTGDRL